MASFDYSRALAAANRLIVRFGQLGVIETPGAVTGPDFNPTPGTPTEAPARFVITAYSSREIDGTRILATDKKALVAPGDLAADPTLSDRLVEADGGSWSIVDIQTLRPAETTLLYMLQVRR